MSQANEAEGGQLVPHPKPQVPIQRDGIRPRTVDELYRFGEMVVRSGLAPRGFARPEAVCVAVGHGLELGLSPMQALQSLIVVEGHVSMYARTARALVEVHPECEWIEDDQHELDGVTEWKDTHAVTVRVQRRGRPNPTVRKFSVADAKRAKLWGKAGAGGPSAWITYPARMLYARALGFALNDQFGDVLKGITTAEELRDYPTDRLESGATLDAGDLDQLAGEIAGQQENA